MPQTIKQLLQPAYRQIDKLDADLLLSFTLNKPREYFIIHDEKIVSIATRNKFNKLVKKRKSGIPLAYITEHKEFFGLDFIVNKHTLIPRPDTEILVESVIETINNEQLTNRKYTCHSRESGNPVLIYNWFPACAGMTEGLDSSHFRGNDKLILIDIGTGSGCIPISILKNIKNTKEIKTFAIDISKKALEVAQKNAKKHKVKINFLHGNLLQSIPNSHEVPLGIPSLSRDELRNHNIIVTANLPYLSEKQYKQEKSIKYEPKSALVAKKEGLDLYEKLLKQIANNYNPSTSLRASKLTVCLEIDPSQSEKIKTLIKQTLPNAKIWIKKDLSGRDRVVIIN